MHVVNLYAGILALLFVALSVRALRMRRRLKIAIGDAGNESMLRAMRVHSNFAEYVPLSLLLMYLAESAGTGAVFIHALGLCVVAGRVLHAIGVSRVNEKFAFRVAGMALTLTTIVITALLLLVLYANRALPNP